MKKYKINLIILLSSFFLISCSNEFKTEKKILRNEQKSVVFKNVNLIPMTEEVVIENQSVFVSNGKIEAIGIFEDFTIPENTQIIDGENKYLIPGLSDMHIHFFYDTDRFLYLANGVTLVRNMRGREETLEIKEKIKQRLLLGPEIFTTGDLIDGKYSYWPKSITLDNPEDVEHVIIQMQDEGYDAVKVYDKLSSEVYFKIMEVAKRIDIPVVGHVPNFVGLESVINAGQQSVEHFDDYILDEDFINLTVESGLWNCPTLVIWYRLKDMQIFIKSKPDELKYISPELLDTWRQGETYIGDIQGYEKLLKTLNDRGAQIVAGTDTGTPYLFAGFSLHEELGHLNHAGLTPYEALKTTTINAAKMLGYEDRLGTIETGKEADLVLLDKNPLANIRNTTSISGVMTKGTWLTKEYLDLMLNDVEIFYANK